MGLISLTNPQRIVPGFGPPDAKIVGVGEAPGAHEDQQLKPFVGPAGGVLEQCIHTAGLIRSEVYLTNVVKVRPKGNDIGPYFSTTTGRFTDAGIEWVVRLLEELDNLQPNVIVAFGQTAMAALTEKSKWIMKYRGYFYPSVGLKREIKVLPTIHPSAALRGMYIYRHIIAADIAKAKEFSTIEGLERPKRTLIWNFQTVSEVLEWLEYYEKQEVVCFDIEVMHYEISCICFCSDPSVAISIPFDSRWTEHDEALIWKGIQRVLGNPKSTKIVQNGIFDIHFLLTRCGIEVRGLIKDTMIAHSILYPELPKRLAFLVSIYGGMQEYYKDMVKFENIKGDA